MAQPVIKSYDQILGEALAAYISAIGVNDLNPNSVIVSLFGTVAQVNYRSTAAILQVISDNSVDRADGDTLRRIAKQEKVDLLLASPATGVVTIKDTSFEKKATKIYAGAPSPNKGSTSILVSDASSFPSTGSIYIGRGTPNIEGPLVYTSITPVGGHYRIDLASPTVKYHNISENVILAQGGNRVIQGGSIVKSVSAGGAEDVKFTTDAQASILDGEVEVRGVKVTAQQVGISGNVPRLAIKEFTIAPFAGATVLNEAAFSNGRDEESNENLRVRIKRARGAKGLGSPLAIKNASYGVSAQDGSETASVISNEILTSGGKTTQYIDDGTGYERKTKGVGLEYLMDSALGGEVNFQLSTGGIQTAVAKAYLQSTNSEPFLLIGNESLPVLVGGALSEHFFAPEDFQSISAATAYEVVASINKNSNLLFSASTAGNGTQVVIFAKEEANENLKITDSTINNSSAGIFGFTSSEVQTLRLYKNGEPLSKDGIEASIVSKTQSNWSNTITDGDTLIISVDGTSFITYVFTNQDFNDLTSYLTVSYLNSLDSWVTVLNSKIVGVTASVEGQSLKLTSNLNTSSRAKITIDPSSTLVTKGMFLESDLTAQGKESDFIFSRNTAQLKLRKPLSVGDSLTAGSSDSEGRLESGNIPGGIVSILSPADFWVLFDDASASIVQHGAIAESELTITKVSPNIIRYTSNLATAFSKVKKGDYLINWCPELNVNNRLEARVKDVTNSYIDIAVTDAEYNSSVAETDVAIGRGFVLVRTLNVPQKLSIPVSTYNINSLASYLNTTIVGGVFSIVEDSRFILETNTKTEGIGSVMLVTGNSSFEALNLPVGINNISRVNHVATYESGTTLGEIPAFMFSKVDAESYADPSSSYIGNFGVVEDFTSLTEDLNLLVKTAQPVNGSVDAQPAPRQMVQISDMSPTTLEIYNNEFYKRLRNEDKVYLAHPFDFGNKDSLTVILDNDATEKSYEVPLYRKALVNSTFINNASSFNAYDSDSGPTTEFKDSFGNDFSFDGYKVLMQAKVVNDPSGDKNSLLFVSPLWGKSGEYYKVAYKYPTQPLQSISSTVIVKDEVTIDIFLKSGTSIVTAITGSTEWDVTITPTADPDKEMVTYTFNGNGTPPNLSPALSGGEYVTIGKVSGFDPKNQGTFKISIEAGFAPSNTSFSVARKAGAAVTEVGAKTLVAAGLSFYNKENTTASELNSYVNSNLNKWLSTKIVEETDTSGSGVVEFSTEEDNDFSLSYLYLKDGINWIKQSSLAVSPQFTFKKPLSYISDTGWNFNEGEEILLIPTTAAQIEDFTNVLAVTGLSILGDIKASSNGSKVQISTKELGSDGSVYIAGGSASKTTAFVVNSGSKDENTMKVNVPSSQGVLFSSGQLVKLAATNLQEKNTEIGNNTTLQITPLSSEGKSLITLGNRALYQRYFGEPKAVGSADNITWKVENQGKFVCISATNGSPMFSKFLDFNIAPSTEISTVRLNGTSYVEYTIFGSGSFQEVAFGDKVSFSGFSDTENNGTFEVVGKSDDGKTLRVLNPKGLTNTFEGQITVSDNALASGVYFTIGNVGGGTHTFTAGVEFAVGPTDIDTAQNLAVYLAAATSYSIYLNGNVIGLSKKSDGTEYFITASAGGFTVVDFSTDTNIVAGTTTTLGEGDIVRLEAPFHVLNRGNFTVVKVFKNSFYIENVNVVEEEVALTPVSVNIGGDNTTVYSITQNGSVKLTYFSGTKPDFSSIKFGDIVTLTGTGINDGSFKVRDSMIEAYQELRVSLVLPSLVAGGSYFLISSPTASYYVWIRVNGVGSDPLLSGRTGIQVDILSSDTIDQFIAKIIVAFSTITDFTATNFNGMLKIVNTSYGPVLSPPSIGTLTGGSMNEYTVGAMPYIEYVNADAVASSVLSSELAITSPAIKFYEYNTAIVGDKFVINNNAFGALNKGSFLVTDVLSYDKIKVSGIMQNVEKTLLGNNGDAVFLQEEKPYLGYKYIKLLATEPANTAQTSMVFTSSNHADKVNVGAEVTISSMNKLNYPEIPRSGLDAYRYDIGLLAEVNRVVYGDPRDTISYPGVAAAGAEIFNDPPLIKRIKLGIDVRVNSGIPFVQLTEQVRSAVSSLVGSNMIGNSIAISSIIATVNSVPGVRALAISSPQYDSNHDIIVLQPNEKSLITNPEADIIVNQIGS